MKDGSSKLKNWIYGNACLHTTSLLTHTHTHTKILPLLPAATRLLLFYLPSVSSLKVSLNSLLSDPGSSWQSQTIFLFLPLLLATHRPSCPSDSWRYCHLASWDFPQSHCCDYSGLFHLYIADSSAPPSPQLFDISHILAQSPTVIATPSLRSRPVLCSSTPPTSPSSLPLYLARSLLDSSRI